MLEYDRIGISEGLMLMKQIRQKNVVFVVTGILKIHIFAMVFMI